MQKLDDAGYKYTIKSVKFGVKFAKHCKGVLNLENCAFGRTKIATVKSYTKKFGKISSKADLNEWVGDEQADDNVSLFVVLNIPGKKKNKTAIHQFSCGSKNDRDAWLKIMLSSA